MIRLHQLTKSFVTRAGRNYLFRDVTMDIPAGKNLAILGPNGVGKSTFLRILGGIDFPDSGRVECPYEVSWPLGIAGGFVGHLTGRENCALVCRAYGLRGREVEERLKFIKALAGIGEYFEEPIRYYSTGMNGRLNFSLSMAFDFDYFLIDEVTSVGDMLFRETAKKALDEKRARSRVIMVSHSMGSLRDFCEIGIVMMDGQMQLFNDLDEAIKAYFPKSAQKKPNLQQDFEGDLDQFFKKAFPQEEGVHAELKRDLRRVLGDLEESLAVATEIEDEAGTWHQMGLLFFHLGNWTRALEYLRKAIYLEEQRLNYYPPLIGCLLQCGKRDEAQEITERVLGWKPDNPAMLNQKAMLCLQDGRLEEALAYAREAAELEPDNAGRWNLLGNIHWQLGDFEQALKSQTRALELNAQAPGHWELLSRILSGLEDWERSLLARMRFQELSAQQRDDDSQEKRMRNIIALAERLISRIR